MGAFGPMGRLCHLDVGIVIRFNCGQRRQGRQCGRRRGVGWILWLYVVEVKKTRQLSNGRIVEVAVGCCVNFKYKHEEEDMEAKSVHPNEPTPCWR